MSTTKLKLTCIYCGRTPKDTKELMEINAYGCHITCDHVMGDYIANEGGL